MNIERGQTNPADRAEGAAALRCFLLVFACFSLTSAGYLSWLYRLMGMANPQMADTLSMVAGYTLQALGIALNALAARRDGRIANRRTAFTAIALYVACLAPALLSTSLGVVVASGLAMNLMCGIIAGFYLHVLVRSVKAGRRGIVFGGGYAAATIATWLLSAIGETNFLQSGYALGLYALVALIVAFLFAKAFPDVSEKAVPADEGLRRDASAAGTPASVRENPGLNLLRDGGSSTGGDGSATPNRLSYESGPAGRADGDVKSDGVSLLVLAEITVVMLSLVKNLGFGFPAADIQQGVSLELSRIFYAAGLIAAGFVNDWNRRYGAVCCLAALVMPFIMLALSSEPVSSMLFWCLDYLFFGFFSVFRVVLFGDLADRSGNLWLASLGLAFGRVGDAAGTGLFMLIGSTLMLVVLAAVLFVACVFLLFLLYQRMYSSEQAAPSAPSHEIDPFEVFCARNVLSAREREVLRLVLDGKSNAEIASELYVSESTVKFHIRNLLKKTGTKNRTELRASYVMVAQSDGPTPALFQSTALKG